MICHDDAMLKIYSSFMTDTERISSGILVLRYFDTFCNLLLAELPENIKINGDCNVF